MCLDLETIRVYHQNESDFGLQGPEGQNFVKFRQEAFRTVGKGFFYQIRSILIPSIRAYSM